MILGLILSLTGIVLLAWTMLRLAAHALPVWLGICVFVWAARGEAGPLAGLLLALVVAVAAFLLGRILLTSRLPMLVRGGVAALFAIPAGIAGFSVAAGLMRLGGAGATAASVIGAVGALAVGVAALASLAAVRSESIAGPPLGRDVAAR
ncbi:hypothetical protein [Novosphingobium mathurense]|uniref:Uncharacterized protein n=1 Tax=Novosphingobium mathurense TaxID=428990 RepID=A0A1U6H6B1_9SPHN|nr:hypothetical protein [Novosphingobium mathurense]SLJ91308.1 hypothetical protein SAMN06295987_1011358 [Novosphingobium mathurense]